MSNKYNINNMENLQNLSITPKEVTILELLLIRAIKDLETDHKKNKGEEGHSVEEAIAEIEALKRLKAKVDPLECEI
jgi:hypothetical protein